MENILKRSRKMYSSCMDTEPCVARPIIKAAKTGGIWDKETLQKSYTDGRFVAFAVFC